MAKPTYLQGVALWELAHPIRHNYRPAPNTMRVLVREGWVRNGRITDAGRAAIGAQDTQTVAPASEPAAHECDEDCYQGYCDQMVYPEPRSIAHTAYHRTGVYLGELRDV